MRVILQTHNRKSTALKFNVCEDVHLLFMDLKL